MFSLHAEELLKLGIRDGVRGKLFHLMEFYLGCLVLVILRGVSQEHKALAMTGLGSASLIELLLSASVVNLQKLTLVYMGHPYKIN